MAHAYQTKDDEWITVWTQAVSKAWTDADFRKSLFTDAKGAIRRAFRFELPAGLGLRVEPGEASKFRSEFLEASEAQMVGAVGAPPALLFDKANSVWIAKPNALLTLVFPDPPDLTHQAVALAEYVKLGMDDGFTCCC
jgi:hypothetical protein